MIKVGDFFTLEEFCVSQTAIRRGLPNDPPEEAVKAIKALCANVLDPLRRKLGKPIVINSGYRSNWVNAAGGGASTSQHLKGEAADIICPGVAVTDVVKAIRELQLPFDQLIDEFGAWTHVSYCPRNRREVLKARRKDGKVVYERVE
jgi:zinc D-Ala-D-Ala carboxypeptidase